MQTIKDADVQRYESYMSYIDIVWKSNNNKMVFINTLNTKVLDVMTVKCNVTLSGAK